MKVWISRSKNRGVKGSSEGIAGTIHVSQNKPKQIGTLAKGNYYYGGCFEMFGLGVRAFKNRYGFTIQPGECIKGRIDVIDIRPVPKGRKRKSSNKLSCVREY